MCYGIFLNYAALRCDCLSRFLGSAQYSFCALFSCVRYFSQEEDGIRDGTVTGVQTCALPISPNRFTSDLAKSGSSAYSRLDFCGLRRSEERRVGEEGRYRGWPSPLKKTK